MAGCQRMGQLGTAILPARRAGASESAAGGCICRRPRGAGTGGLRRSGGPTPRQIAIIAPSRHCPGWLSSRVEESQTLRQPTLLRPKALQPLLSIGSVMLLRCAALQPQAAPSTKTGTSLRSKAAVLR